MADEREKVVLESACHISWSKVHEIPIECTQELFLDSLKVWIDKPHVVNRRLSGSLTLKRAFLTRTSHDDLISFATTGPVTAAEDICSKIDEYQNADDVAVNSSSVEIVLRRLLPRLMAKSDRLVEIVVIGKNISAIILLLSSISISYFIIVIIMMFVVIFFFIIVIVMIILMLFTV